MPSSSRSSSDSGSDSDSKAEWTCNEGETTDEDEVTEAHASMRGMACLVTASCPRTYPRDVAVRRATKRIIPDDITKEDFVRLLRKVVNKHSNVKVEKASCHAEPHKRFRRSQDRREVHKHVAALMSGSFAHKKISDAFHKETGLRISFSFKLPRFVGNLRYLMVAGKKPSTDLDMEPAVFPPNLDVQEELKKASHPGGSSAGPPGPQNQQKEHRTRKRLNFDEVSNIVLEGIGDGPLRSGRDLEKAAWSLKEKGKVELWNYIGAMKEASDIGACVAKVWRFRGVLEHPMWRKQPPHALSTFSLDGLGEVSAWAGGKYKTHALVLSGDGELGKTSLAEALVASVSPGGYWFVDDPDDFKEIDGMLAEGHGLVIDEVCLAKMPPNQVKKMLDLEKSRRVSCRHFNGTIPKGCPRILCTNSSVDEFYPRMTNPHDRKGVMRRQMWQSVSKDTRAPRQGQRAPIPAAPAAPPAVARLHDEEEDPFGFGGGMDDLDAPGLDGLTFL